MSTKKQDDIELYNNSHRLKFAFLITPNSVTKSHFGLSLTFLVKVIAIIYSFRAITTTFHSFSNPKLKMDNIDLFFNYLCIITAILQYISIYTKSYIISYSVYLVYFSHFLIKAGMSSFILYKKLTLGKILFNTFLGISLGLSFGTLMNLLSTWIIFSYFVFCYNYNINKIKD